MATMTRRKNKELAIKPGDHIALAYKLEPYDPKNPKEDLRPVFSVIDPPGDPGCVGLVRRVGEGMVTVDVERKYLVEVDPGLVLKCPACGRENDLGTEYCGGAPLDPDDDFTDEELRAIAIQGGGCGRELDDVEGDDGEPRKVERIEARTTILPFKTALKGHVRVKKNDAVATGDGENARGAAAGGGSGAEGAAAETKEEEF